MKEGWHEQATMKTWKMCREGREKGEASPCTNPRKLLSMSKKKGKDNRDG